MGERLESLQPTAEVNSRLSLDEETFSLLSQTIDGLSLIESEEILADFALERADIDDVIYTFKFISDPQVFEYISNSEFSSLGPKEQEQAKEYANLMKDALSENPVVYEVPPFKEMEQCMFIAFVNKKSSKLNIVFKNATSNEHLLNYLLKKENGDIENYPQDLRSFGAIQTYSQENVTMVRFFGEAMKKDKGVVHYAPGFLKKYKDFFESRFKHKFSSEKVKVEF